MRCGRGIPPTLGGGGCQKVVIAIVRPGVIRVVAVIVGVIPIVIIVVVIGLGWVRPVIAIVGLVRVVIVALVRASVVSVVRLVVVLVVRSVVTVVVPCDGWANDHAADRQRHHQRNENRPNGGFGCESHCLCVSSCSSRFCTAPDWPGVSAPPIRPSWPSACVPVHRQRAAGHAGDDRTHGTARPCGSRHVQQSSAARELRGAGGLVAANAVRNTWHHWSDLRRAAAGTPTLGGIIKLDDCLLESRRILSI